MDLVFNIVGGAIGSMMFMYYIRKQKVSNTYQHELEMKQNHHMLTDHEAQLSVINSQLRIHAIDIQNIQSDINLLKHSTEPIQSDSVIQATKVDMNPQELFECMTKNSVIPQRASDGSAGFDLHCDEERVIKAHTHSIVTTGIRIRMPECKIPGGRYKHFAKIHSRSGMSGRHGIEVGAGVIDSDYRGMINVVLYNHSDKDYLCRIGDRIAQLIIEVCSCPSVYDVKRVTGSDDVHITRIETDTTKERGDGGFGSSGFGKDFKSPSVKTEPKTEEDADEEADEEEDEEEDTRSDPKEDTSKEDTSKDEEDEADPQDEAQPQPLHKQMKPKRID
jgi:dUTP pyrophosphatase